MDCQPENAITAERCNQADEQRSGADPPGQSNPKVASKGVAHWNAVVREAAALDAGHSPSCDQGKDKRLQVIEDELYRIKERPRFDMEYLWEDPVHQKSQTHEDADENEQAPTGAQPRGVKEDFLHVGRVRLRDVLRSTISLVRKAC